MEEKCTNEEYQQCLQSLENVAKGEDVTLVTSKGELDNACRLVMLLKLLVSYLLARILTEVVPQVNTN